MKKKVLAILLTAAMALALPQAAVFGDELPSEGSEAVSEEDTIDEDIPEAEDTDIFEAGADWVAGDTFDGFEGPAEEEEEAPLDEDAEVSPLNEATDISSATVSGLKDFLRIEQVSTKSNDNFKVFIDGKTEEEFLKTLTLKLGNKTLTPGTDYKLDSYHFSGSLFYIYFVGIGDYTGELTISRPGYCLYTIAGKNRWATNAALVNLGNQSFERIVVVWGRDFPDALAANAYAGLKHSPLFLTERDSVPDAVAKVIKKHADIIKEVVIIGGKMDGATKELKKLVPSASFKTIAGKNRYQTADKVTKEFLLERFQVALDDKTTQVDYPVFVATGESPADALSASTWSYIRGIPVLLVQNGTFNKKSDTANVLKHFKSVILLGGTNVVKDSVVPKGAAKIRLGGKNRWKTSRLIADFFINDTYGQESSLPVFMLYAPGADELFADALAAGQFRPLGLSAVILVDKNHAEPFDFTKYSQKNNVPLYAFHMFSFGIGSAGKDAGSGSSKGVIYKALRGKLEPIIKKSFDDYLNSIPH